MFHKRSTLITALSMLVVLQSVVEPVFAGACLCVTTKRTGRGGEKVISFECSESNSESSCKSSCDKSGHTGYEYFDDENCDDLYRKIHEEKIKLNIKKIRIGPVEISGAVNSAQKKPSTPALDTFRRGSAEIEGLYDEFEIPDSFGGGSASTSAFEGTIEFELRPSPADPHIDLVKITAVKTTAKSINLNGFETGTLFGTLNEKGFNAGTWNHGTGYMEMQFSQNIYVENAPSAEVRTHSAYWGFCSDCDTDAAVIALTGDSIFIYP